MNNECIYYFKYTDYTNQARGKEEIHTADCVMF